MRRTPKFTKAQERHIDTLRQSAYTEGYNVGRQEAEARANDYGITHAVNVNTVLQEVVAKITALIRANSPQPRRQ